LSEHGVSDVLISVWHNGFRTGLTVLGIFYLGGLENGFFDRDCCLIFDRDCCLIF
jgi:hypothetical protein